MALGVSNVMAVNGPGNGLPTGTETNRFVHGPTSDARLNVVAGQAAPIGGAEKVETQQAVRPTPASSGASKVDLGSDRLTKEDMNKYPITGPDKFARNVALQNEHALEEHRAESVQVDKEDAARAVDAVNAEKVEARRSEVAMADERADVKRAELVAELFAEPSTDAVEPDNAPDAVES